MDTKKYNFLIIEDEEILLKVIEQKLKISGINTISFKTGGEALDYLYRTENLPDIVWLDYYLPDMNGVDLMRKLKEDKRYDKLMIVVVSNSANDETVAKMLNLGIKAYIIKAEHRLEDIISRMLEFLGK